ncbi:hypothetical protein [Sphingomonas sp.]|uniref:hypothetical protein n=1 Tax=Sphingomonas sp. TaxID=28214 RepID=UPI003CC670E2
MMGLAMPLKHEPLSYIPATCHNRAVTRITFCSATCAFDDAIAGPHDRVLADNMDNIDRTVAA